MTVSDVRPAPPVSPSRVDSRVNGDSDADLVTRLRPGGRRRRIGLAAVGGLFILIAALLGASLVGSLRSSTEVLVMQGDLAPGEVLTAGDLIVAELGADGLGQLSFVPAAEQDTVVGLTALGPVPAGSLVSPEMFGRRADLVPAGHAVVGVVLDRGALPAGIVQPGDEVELIAAADSARAALDPEAPVATMVGRATVWMVEPALDLERGTSVSVVVASDLVPAVAQAAADNRLRLGLVGR